MIRPLLLSVSNGAPYDHSALLVLEVNVGRSPLVLLHPLDERLAYSGYAPPRYSKGLGFGQPLDDFVRFLERLVPPVWRLPVQFGTPG